MHSYALSLRRVGALIGVLATCFLSAPAASNYYVDPVSGLDTNAGTSTGAAFRTLAKARDTVRAAIAGGMTQDVVVNLRGGRHVLTSALDLTDADSGRNGWTVVWRAYTNETPVIDGGKAISGFAVDPGDSTRWRAAVSAGDDFRILWVNGDRRQRAQTTNTVTGSGWYPSAANKQGIIVPNSVIGLWGNPADIEVTWKYVWRHHRLPVSSIVTVDANNKAIVFEPNPLLWALTMPYTGGQPDPARPFRIENAVEVLDTAGEWYLDRAADYVYYKPLAGETLATTTFTAPVIDGALIRVTGASPSARASNLRFEGLTFSQAGYKRADTLGALPVQGFAWAGGTVPAASGETGYVFPPGALQIKNAQFIEISGCTFERLGAMGVFFESAVADTAVRHSLFRDISETAIGASSPVLANLAADEGKVERLLVADNYIRNAGAEYFAACAIHLFYAQDSTIENNDLGNLPYTGISVGWGFANNTVTNKNARNAVLGNKVFNFLNQVVDGGGIYGNGKHPDSANGSVWAFNYIYDMKSSSGALYPDEGSNYIEVQDNVAEKIAGGANWLHIWISSIDAINAHDNFTDATSGANPNGRYLDNSGDSTVTATTLYTLPSRPAGAGAIRFDSGVRVPRVDEDLADGVADGWAPGSGTWGIAADAGNNVYRQSATTGIGLSLFTPIAPTDFSASFRIKPTALGGGGTPTAGAVFRYHDSSNYYYLILKPGLNQLSLGKVVAGTATSLGLIDPYSISLNTWYSYRVVIRGQRLQVFDGISGSTLFDVAADPSLMTGQFGLRNYLAAANYDDLRLSPSMPAIFADTFADQVTDGWSVVSGTWAPVSDAGNPAYEQSSTAGESIAVAGAPRLTLADGAISARLKITAGTGSGAGVVFRYVDVNNHYLAYLQRSDNTLRIYRRQNASTYTSLASVPFTVATGTWYDLSVLLKGSSIVASVGSTSVSVADESFVYGQVGVRTNAVSARFDDLVVNP